MADLRMPWRGSMTPRAREKALAPLLREDEPALDVLRPSTRFQRLLQKIGPGEAIRGVR